MRACITSILDASMRGWVAFVIYNFARTAVGSAYSLGFHNCRGNLNMRNVQMGAPRLSPLCEKVRRSIQYPRIKRWEGWGRVCPLHALFNL